AKSMVTPGSSAPTATSPEQTFAVQEPTPYEDAVLPEQVPALGLYSGATPQLLQVDRATPVSVEPVSMDNWNGWVAIVTGAEKPISGQPLSGMVTNAPPSNGPTAPDDEPPVEAPVELALEEAAEVPVALSPVELPVALELVEAPPVVPELPRVVVVVSEVDPDPELVDSPEVTVPLELAELPVPLLPKLVEPAELLEDPEVTVALDPPLEVAPEAAHACLMQISPSLQSML
ncbi:MAG: hypothetical protein L3J72_04780, partial [Thermoplasmata archaeon]|nr:hypothetical protein [Thermoplasmata archaeon]